MRVRIVWLLASSCFLFALSISTAQAQDAAEGKQLYVSYCSTCHGDTGKGDGVVGRSLPVKPADHTNGTVMNQLSDQFLHDIIAKGGTAVGKSSFMPSWGSSLDEKQIRDLLAYLRSIADPPYKGGKPAPK
jgi:mono/diheme cytochrome c family protein